MDLHFNLIQEMVQLSQQIQTHLLIYLKTINKELNQLLDSLGNKLLLMVVQMLLITELILHNKVIASRFYNPIFWILTT